MNLDSAVFRVFKNQDLPIPIEGKGAEIITEEGKFLDLTGGGTSYCILGWNHPKVNEAISTQLTKFGHLDYKLWRDPNVEELAEIVVSKAPSELRFVYFGGNSGAEACEAAMKISYQSHFNKGNQSKKWFISREQSYHGATSDALSLGDRPNLAFYKPMLSPYRSKVPMHHYKKMGFSGETELEYAKRSAQQLETEILRIGPNYVAGFIGETIMGGLVGDVPPAKTYWQEIEKVCKKYEVHLILDEVYCGTGVSGKYFCYEYDDVNPDIVFMSKTVAAGYGVLNLVCVTNEIYDSIRSYQDGRLQHTTTHQAHSLSVAAALAVQKIVSNEDFLSDVHRKGLKFREILGEMLIDNDALVDIRGRGLRFSLEHKFKNQLEFGAKIENALREQGILINAKWHRICFTPPLILSDDQIEYAAETFSHKFEIISKQFDILK